MKRLITVLLAICMICCLFPVSALAANNTYDLDELGMSIAIPADHVVFTRNIKDNDPNLIAYGLKKDDMLSLMQERSIYLNAWDSSINYEIVVTMIDSPLEDYNQFSDTTLTVLASALDAEYANLGITYIRSELHQHDQAKFIKIYISQPNGGSTVYGLQYNTVYDGKAINVTLQSYSGEIDSGKEAFLQSIVDSIRFDAQPQPDEQPPAQTEAFTYVDPDSGLTFEVPENWVETPMNEEREFIDVKFTSNLEEGLSIIFSSEDIYETEGFLPGLTGMAFSREEVGNDFFTKADIAEVFGCSEEEVSMVTYGGKEYYTAETVTTGTVYGITVSISVVYLLRCENGYMYMFQFSGSGSSEYFRDFEALVSSAEYPVFELAVEEPADDMVEEPADDVVEEPADDVVEEPADDVVEEPADDVVEEPAEDVVEEPAEDVEEPVAGVVEEPVDKDEAEEEEEEPADGEKQDLLRIAVVLLAVMLLIVLCILVIVLCRSAARKKAAQKKGQAEQIQAVTAPAAAAPTYTAVEKPAPQEPSATAEKEEPNIPQTENRSIKNEGQAFCHQCGSKLVSGNLFCDQCGTPIVR